MKDLSGRLVRWPLQLQGCDFTIELRKGSENGMADTLSSSVKAVGRDPKRLLEFEVPKFEIAKYQPLLEQVRLNQNKLLDLKVEYGLLFKRMGLVRLEDELEGTLWKM